LPLLRIIDLWPYRPLSNALNDRFSLLDVLEKPNLLPSLIELTGWRLEEIENPFNPFKDAPIGIITITEAIILLKDWMILYRKLEKIKSDELLKPERPRPFMKDAVMVEIITYNSTLIISMLILSFLYHDMVRSASALGLYQVMSVQDDSFKSACYGYFASLFPSITEWRALQEGNISLESRPWESIRTLWLAGYIPIYDGNIWRLHSGSDGKVVLEMPSQLLGA
jgi:hypothetical protein